MDIRLFLVPYDSGNDSVRMGAGPAALAPVVSEALKARGHRVHREAITAYEQFPAEVATTFLLCRKLATRVREARAEGEFAVVLSGNCNAALGTLAGLGCEETGILWFDAHGEFNTPETSTSGFLDGMGLAIATGRCWRRMAEAIPGYVAIAPEAMLLAGVRELESAERTSLEAAGVRMLRPEEVNGRVFPAAVQTLAGMRPQAYVHLDMDALDASEGRANRWAGSGGLSTDQMENAVASAREHLAIAGIGIASYDPAVDTEGKVSRIIADLIRLMA